MMHEIVRARMALTPAIEKTEQLALDDAKSWRSAYLLKRHAIQYSLYGVDEDPGAVEIAKLRLWLSMVVDEHDIGEIQPLPNLDYRIMQGNALLQEFAGIPLFDESMLEKTVEELEPDRRLVEIELSKSRVQTELVRLQQSGRLTRKQSDDLKREGARLTKKQKALLNAPMQYKSTNLELSLGIQGTLKHIQQLHAEYFDEASRERKKQLREELDRYEWDFMRATLREHGREEDLPALERASAKHRKSFFLWRLHFAEVFTRNGGFDVVIANPPYVRIQELAKELPDVAERLKSLYDSASSGNYDLYVVFIEFGLRLLAKRGVASFIQPHKFFNANYGRNLRRHLAQGRHVEHIVHFGDQQIFEGATNYVCLLFLTQRANATFSFVKVEDLDRWYAAGEGLEGRFPAEKLGETNWSVVVGRGGSLKDRLSSIPQKLKHVTSRIFQGLKTSADKIYIVENRGCEGRNIRVFCRQDEREHLLEPDLLHPLVKGGDSKAYSLRITERLILFPYALGTNGKVALIAEPRLRRISAHLAFSG